MLAAQPRIFYYADVAQLVEQALRKRHVAGSSPAIGSMWMEGAKHRRPPSFSLTSAHLGLQSCVLDSSWRLYAFTLLLLLSLLLELTSCSSATLHRGILRLPLYSAVRSLDPAAATSSTLLIDSLLYSGLVKFSPDLHIIPELAVSIPTISSNGRTYTFTIRQDARFADGIRCTAADVVYSLSRALRPGIGSS